tara:strand:+ start:6718 stop:7377 length:660 start_codon:yes stop_codon:yes gene_type:complete
MTNASFRPLEKDKNTLNRLGTEAVDNFIGDLFSSDSVVRTAPGSFVKENSPSGNNFILGRGSHHGFKLEKPHTILEGEAGTIVDRYAEIRHHAVISNVHFKQLDDPSNEDVLVRLVPHEGATAFKPIRVLFRQCIFERKFNASRGTGAANTKAFVVVNSLARAVFTGCVFRSNRDDGVMDGFGTVVQSLNALATEVYVTSGVNMTTHTHNNVTIVGPEI